MSKVETEVLIIGGGILGTAIARELSKYKVDATLVEKDVDFGQNLTKVNAQTIKDGGAWMDFGKEDPRSNLIWKSIPMMDSLCQELDVPFRTTGMLTVFKDNRGMALARETKQKADAWLPHLEPLQIIDRETLRSWEPNINKGWIGALYDPKPAVTDPVRMAIALAENAKQNGVNLMTETEVLNILPGTGEFEVRTNNGPMKSRFIVNAAGEYTDKVARLANADDFVLTPILACSSILDKKLGGLINSVIIMNSVGGRWLVPTIHGNIMSASYGVHISKRGEHPTTRWMIDATLAGARLALPDISISAGDAISSFVGIQVQREPFGMVEGAVGVSRWVPRFINVHVPFPGVSASPATAKEVVGLLAREGLKLEENPDFNPYRKAIPVFNELSDEEKRQLIAQDPRYGHLVCRCETVTEGEIVEAIKRGATTLDGVKFRCRPGMGRCQGGFCSPRVMKILARELNIPEEEVTKKGPGSRHLLFKSKELLGR